jgi:hypothetical protein
MYDLTPALDNFAGQAKACAALGSPFTARLCRMLPNVLDERTGFGRAVLGWPDSARADALALRVCGGLHALRRRIGADLLAPVYPPHDVPDHELFDALAAAIAQHDKFLLAYLDSPPQTNEVARSGIILAGMTEVVRVTGQPLETLEIGASAGLNLGFADYRYDLGNGRRWGRADAPLTLACDWQGAVPELVDISVAARAGCDRNPLDASNPEHRARLTSYVWPDQEARLARIEAALAHAARIGTKVELADAARWLEQRLAQEQPAGTTRVVYHSIVWQYLPEATAARAAAAIAAAGTRATPKRPLAHLSIESDHGPDFADGASMKLTLWPDGLTREIARADFHGRWVRWV